MSNGNGWTGGIPPSRQPYAGGGEQLLHGAVNPLRPQGYQPWPGLDLCMESFRNLLEGSITTNDLAPHLGRGFKARTIYPFNRAVINVPFAVNPGANAAGIALAAAENAINPTAVALLTPPAATPAAPQSVLTFQSTPGTAAIFKTVGVTVEVGAKSAATVTLTVNGGPNTGSAPPNPRLGSSFEEEQQQTLLIVPDNKRLQVLVGNLDTTSPLLVSVALSGWILPIRAWKDTLKSLISRPGIGPVCEKD